MHLDTPNLASAAKLFLKIKAVSDGNKEDMKEAVTQVDRQGIMGPSMVIEVVSATDYFVQTWIPILDRLEALQMIGFCLSEVSPLIPFFILDISQPATKVHPYAMMVLNLIPNVNVFHSKLPSANEEMQGIQC